MIKMENRDLTAEQARLLKLMRTGRPISRAAFHGQPFGIEGTPHQFPEQVVLGLADAGLLRVIQTTTGWAGVSDPCPFSLLITTEGETIRAGLISGARQPQSGAA